jgi:hypothetical protein
MAAESKDERTRGMVGRPQRRPRVEAMDGILEVELRPELLKRAMAAAKACGQTPSEWICEAVTEAIERKSKVGKSKVVRKQ